MTYDSDLLAEYAKGAATAPVAGKTLGLRPAQAKSRTHTLVKHGLVEQVTHRRGGVPITVKTGQQGRPAKLWILTSKGRRAAGAR